MISSGPAGLATRTLAAFLCVMISGLIQPLVAQQSSPNQQQEPAAGQQTTLPPVELPESPGSSKSSAPAATAFRRRTPRAWRFPRAALCRRRRAAPPIRACACAQDQGAAERPGPRLRSPARRSALDRPEPCRYGHTGRRRRMRLHGRFSAWVSSRHLFRPVAMSYVAF